MAAGLREDDRRLVFVSNALQGSHYQLGFYMPIAREVAGQVCVSYPNPRIYDNCKRAAPHVRTTQICDKGLFHIAVLVNIFYYFKLWL